MHIILAQLIIELTHAPIQNPQGGLDDNNAHPAQVSWYNYLHLISLRVLSLN
jgi:hypothetical protein